MRVNLVKIGNSRGIRIPASVLQVLHSDAFELSFDAEKIILQPLQPPRAGWAEAFHRALPSPEEPLLIPDTLDEDLDGWEW